MQKGADENDSEPFPVEISYSSMGEFIEKLKEVVEVSDEKPIHIVVNKTRILDTKLFEDNASFVLSVKVKSNLIRIHLDSN